VIIHYREGKEDSVKKGIINPCFDPDDPISAQASTLVKASETPMLSLIEERLAKIDWDKKKATVKDRYYARLPDPYLPPATEFKTRLVSMDVKVLQDIVMPNGEVVARRGEIINPLSVSPLYEHYLVINPRIKSQIDWAKKYITDNTDQQVVVMLDGAPEQKNPEGFASIEQQLRMPVYLLNDAVSERFHIRSTPTLIKQSDNTNIQVSEVALYE
jgi:conjugal transfer pilus assembly protein TraW